MVCLRRSSLLLLSAVTLSLGYAIPRNLARSDLASRQTSSKIVSAHFIMGIVGNRVSAADYDDDMKRAAALGIDAFALNIGKGQEQQLQFAYDSAATNNMKAFISFDCSFFQPGDEGLIGNIIGQVASKPAQLKFGSDNKVFVSTFIGDGLNVQAIRDAAGVPIFFVPNFHVGQSDFAPLDGAMNWLPWPSNGRNKAPQVDNSDLVTVASGDQSFINALAGKEYLPTISPWFSTHFGGEVPFSKNWVFPSDLLIFNRWNELLTLAPSMVEIATWNDYGESHYIGPLTSKHTDDGASRWANDMSHTGWGDLSKPFIAAYKAGATSVNDFIKEEKLVYWYRITPKGLDCDSTDTTFGPGNNATGDFFNGRPNGFDILQDDVFVVSLLQSPGTVTVNSGGTVYTFDAPAGASAFQAPFKVGTQAFALNRNGAEVMSATSLKAVQDTCPCGLYNFNAYVGTVPDSGERDVLSADGLASFTQGLKVACDPSPSLPASPPPTAAPTTTVSVSAAPTATV